MNSSISSSEPEAGAWGRFAWILLAAAVVLILAFIAFAYAVDPYDTGRSNLFAKAGVRPQGPRTAAPSRGRDPAFNAAIIGNSHIQLLSPEHLKQSTGLDFVQLSVPATGPQEQLVIIDWFLQHHAQPPRALVVSADEGWCTLDPAMPIWRPFPFWLFSTSPIEYARNLLRYDLLEEVPRRLFYVFDKNPKRAEPNGYWNYEPEYMNMGYGAITGLRKRLEERPEIDKQILATDPMAGKRIFPAAKRLKALASSLSPETILVLVFPPDYKNYLPPESTPRAYVDQECKAALRAALESHIKSKVIDWRVDRPENRNPDLYFDMTHYRLPIAQKIEADVAQAIASWN